MPDWFKTNENTKKFLILDRKTKKKTKNWYNLFIFEGDFSSPDWINYLIKEKKKTLMIIIKNIFNKWNGEKPRRSIDNNWYIFFEENKCSRVIYWLLELCFEYIFK